MISKTKQVATFLLLIGSTLFAQAQPRYNLYDLGPIVGTNSTSPDVAYRVQLWDNTAFDNTANNHKHRPFWQMDPIFSTETHCTRAAYDSLKAGGVDLPSDFSTGQILPNWLANMLYQAYQNDPTLVQPINAQ